MYEKGAAKFDWWQDWRGECVAIVAAGPSASKAGVEKLKDRIHVIVVNDSYRLCPWAEILYACEGDWWVTHGEKTKKFSGIKLMHDDGKRRIPGVGLIKIPQIRNIWAPDFQFDSPGVVGSGGNSGFQMINLSAQFGCAGIGLVGFDMNGIGGIHWHGKHPSPLRNPDHSRFEQWRADLDRCAPALKPYDIDVVNCSATSSLKSFPKMTIDEMLERWGL